MNSDSKLIFENYIDGVTRTKNALGGHIMSIVKYGIPTKKEFIKIRQELHDRAKEIEARGTPPTEEEREWAHEIIAKIKNYRSQHPNDPPPYEGEENAEGMSDKEYHKARKFGLEVSKEEVGKGPIKIQLTKDQALLCTRDGSEQEVKFVKGVVFNCDEWVGDYYHCESDKYGGVAVFPPDIKLLSAPKGAITHLTDENAEDMSKSPFHYDPMKDLAPIANKIYNILKSAGNDEARPEHIEKMAEIILGPQSEYASVDHYEKALSGVIELLNHYVNVPMNEGEEMPEKDFNKLKQHINKGPLKVKKDSKELAYTHKYIHHLAKQDPREGQREENEERICIEDLAVKHGVSLEEMQKQLGMGIKVETEHTDDFDVATKIALDHLNEDPEYYTKLAKMEGKEENAEKYVYDNIEVAFNLNGREYIAYGDVHFGQEDLHGKEEDTVENFGVIDATTKQEVQDDAVIRHGYNAVYNAGVNQSAEENEERRIDPKCWKGYHKQGTKLKNGVRVNNCVKNS